MTAEMLPSPDPTEPTVATIAANEAKLHLIAYEEALQTGSDEAASIKARADAAFAVVTEHTYSDLYALVHRTIGASHEDIQDVVQEVYIRAYRGLKNFRGEGVDGRKVQIGTWLHRITVNCSITFAGKRGRQPRTVELIGDEMLEDMVADDERYSPEAEHRNSQLREQLIGELALLPKKTRDAVILRDVYDLPHQEVAKQLNISPTAAKVRVHRGRKTLVDRIDWKEARQE